ncbi:hypothetical protein FALBO_408 [Fusarium albosuccineum]|uniref:Uncharacterized protein n=1 Tax=Fusarium albosuccineum TaxID=1237068 RepID=A0A8H4LQF0_9HYPO|nr:hypothetical protein FALBO_408 [Fusarium albosuccineum]
MRSTNEPPTSQSGRRRRRRRRRNEGPKDVGEATPANGARPRKAKLSSGPVKDGASSRWPVADPMAAVDGGFSAGRLEDIDTREKRFHIGRSAAVAAVPRYAPAAGAMIQGSNALWSAFTDTLLATAQSRARQTDADMTLGASAGSCFAGSTDCQPAC